MAKSCEQPNLARRCEPNWGVVAGSVGTGIVLGIIGAAISPDHKDVMQFVNQSNAQHPESPIRFQLGLVGNRAPGFSISAGLPY